MISRHGIYNERRFINHEHSDEFSLFALAFLAYHLLGLALLNFIHHFVFLFRVEVLLNRFQNLFNFGQLIFFFGVLDDILNLRKFLQEVVTFFSWFRQR